MCAPTFFLVIRSDKTLNTLVISYITDRRQKIGFINDGDGVSDVQEAADGTDPMDRNSCSGCFNLDIDVDGVTAALTDGLLVLRHLFGFADSSLIDGAMTDSATRIEPAAIATYLETNLGQIDIDADGKTEALTDGLLLLRYLFGFDGDALIQGAVAESATRTTAEEIREYIATMVVTTD